MLRKEPTTEFGVWKRWTSKSGRVSVAEFKGRGQPTRFVVRRRLEGDVTHSWETVSRHGSRRKAFAAAKRLERRLRKAK